MQISGDKQKIRDRLLGREMLNLRYLGDIIRIEMQ
jgi:hypothetical protein